MANFGNHRYSHGPETVSQSHSHVPKTAHDITQTAPQIACTAVPSTAITGTILSPEVSKRL